MSRVEVRALALSALAFSLGCASPRGSAEAEGAARGGSPTGPPASGGAPVVVVELFSSEGCSSCPPADAILADLAASSGEGAQVIALEHHVDYWDDLGWKDPYSSSASTRRQRGYARARGDGGIFTPEAVVDGEVSLTGSRRDQLLEVVRERGRAPRMPVTVTLDPDGRTARVDLGADPPRASDLVVAVTEHGLVTAIPRGENAGATVRHGPIVRWMGSAGEARAGRTEVELEEAVTGSRRSVVAFVQIRPQGEIVGAATARGSTGSTAIPGATDR